MKNIPRIIHQIWSDADGGSYPAIFEEYKNTWIRDYPSWEYILWDQQKIDDFIIENYSQYWKRYNEFPYNIQRWDAARYLILYKLGGMYVDTDYESIKPLINLLTNQTCCFPCESIFGDEQGHIYKYFNNALIIQ